MAAKKDTTHPRKLISHPLFVAIVTVVLTLLGTSLYNYWQSKTQTLLDVKGEYQSFEMPSVLFSAYKDYTDSISPDSLEKVTPEISKLRGDSSSTSLSLYRYLNELQVKDVITDLKYVRGFWKFSIENRGSKKIENLALFVPFNGFYELTQNEATQSAIGKFDKNIDIGDIKPSNSVLIKIWSDHIVSEIKGVPYFSSFEDKPKVTFENGFKIADFSRN